MVSISASFGGIRLHPSLVFCTGAANAPFVGMGLWKFLGRREIAAQVGQRVEQSRQGRHRKELPTSWRARPNGSGNPERVIEEEALWRVSRPLGEGSNGHRRLDSEAVPEPRATFPCPDTEDGSIGEQPRRPLEAVGGTGLTRCGRVGCKCTTDR